MPAPIGNTSGRKWMPDHDAALRSLVETNEMSYAGIASRINSRFGTTFSRNAAIGRAGRMGLINPFKVKKAKPSGAKVKNRPRARIISNNSNSNSMRVIQSVESVADLKLRCVEIIPRNLSLLELQLKDCRYPYGDGPYTFCGHPKMEGRSYCESHYALSVNRHGNVGHTQSPAGTAALRRMFLPTAQVLREKFWPGEAEA